MFLLLLPEIFLINSIYSQLYNTDCRGSACHGGNAIAMDYTYMKNNEPAISSMMKTGGQTHPGGPLSVAPSTSATFLAWYAQGAKP